MSARPLDRWDGAAFTTLSACALVVGWPVLGGGALTYLDNPAHLAEVHSLAADGGWSDIAYGGFPLGVLHSPLWYGALSAIAAVGLNPLVPYTAFVLLGALAPSLALYVLGRSCAKRQVALGAALLLLLQPHMLSGIASPFGGMWTHGIALGGCIALVYVALTQDTHLRSVAMAVLVAVIGLTHVFALPAAALLLLVTAAWRRSKDPAFRWWRDLLAGGLGLIISSSYWGRLVGSATMILRGQHLSPTDLARALAGHADFVTLISRAPVSVDTDVVISALPALALLLAAGWALVAQGAPAPARIGAAAGATMLGLLVIVHYTDAPLLGPLSWRQIPFVEGCLAMVALGVRLPWSVPRRAGAPLMLVAALSCVLWGTPLRGEVPPSTAPELADVDRLWTFLREHRDERWGRVLLQDTFLAPVDGGDSTLYRSHVLALTASMTGVHQVGAYYGLAPFATGLMTYSDSGMLMGLEVDDDPAIVSELGTRMDEFDVTHIVTTTRATRGWIARRADAAELASFGRFAVFARGGDDERWVDVGTTVRNARATWHSASIVSIEGEVTREDGNLRLASAYHPFWHLTGANGGYLATSQRGLTLLRGLHMGPLRSEMRFEPPTWPSWLGFGGLAFLFAWGLWARRRAADYNGPGRSTPAR